MSLMASQITSLTIVYSPVCSGTDQRKHQKLRVTSLCRGIHRGPVNSPHKKASNAEIFFIWWRHHEKFLLMKCNGLINDNPAVPAWWHIHHLNHLGTILGDYSFCIHLLSTILHWAYYHIDGLVQDVSISTVNVLGIPIDMFIYSDTWCIWKLFVFIIRTLWWYVSAVIFSFF